MKSPGVRPTVAVGLAPFHGRVWTPCWALRPGTVSELGSATKAISLWLTIYSVNIPAEVPCYCEEATLGATLGVDRSTVSRRLRLLRQVPGLLLELNRGRSNETGRFHSALRWATDPLLIWHTAPKIEIQLPLIASQHALDGDWLEQSYGSLQKHVRNAKRLAQQLSLSLVGDPGPCIKTPQYGVGGGEGRMRCKRSRRCGTR
jgi:hypothetical protein